MARVAHGVWPARAGRGRRDRRLTVAARWLTHSIGLVLAVGFGLTLPAAAPGRGVRGEGLPAQPSDTATSAEEALLTMYAPVLAVREQPVACESGEPYLPMSVEDLFRAPGLILRGPGGHNVDQPSVDDLAAIAPGDDWHIDIPGNALSPGCSYERLYDGIGADPVAYGRVVTDPAHPGSVVVQYWYFYIYNDWNDRHEGDWEMIQLVFVADDAAAALLAPPRQAMYAQHEGGEVSSWEGGPLQLRGDTHPVVFVAAGSHAAYFSAERWFGKSAASGFGCDDTRPPTVEVSPRIIPLRGDESWLSFTGRWGEQQPSFNNGPTGPSTKTQWAAPVTWVDDEGRVGAVELPAQGSFATSAFCVTVRGGSLAFLRFLDAPIRVVLLLGAVVLALVVIARQTRWRGASLSPVLQRRRAGQHLGAAILLTRTRPALFVPLAALLPIAGVAAAGAQWWLTERSELGDVPAVVGSGSPWLTALATFIGLVVSVPVTSIVYVAVAAVVRDLASGVAPSWRRGLTAVREHPRGVVVELLTRAATNTLLLTVVLSPIALLLLARWCVVAPSSLEGRHPARRSADLTRAQRLAHRRLGRARHHTLDRDAHVGGDAPADPHRLVVPPRQPGHQPGRSSGHPDRRRDHGAAPRRPADHRNEPG